MISLGKVVVMSSSRKQKLNVKRWTESELVGADYLGPIILWRNYFIEGQGYTVEINIIYQDNKSKIILDKRDIVQLEENKSYKSEIFNQLEDRQGRYKSWTLYYRKHLVRYSEETKAR